MLQYIQKHHPSNTENCLFSILIPTWNNLPYLKNCIEGIRAHSRFTHQVIVIINEGKDDTLNWVKEQNLDYVYAEKNIGICYGLNIARGLVKTNYVLYINDDMFVLPDWDAVLKEEIDAVGHKNFMLSATMIEPVHTGNNCVVVKDFGRDLETFQKEAVVAAAPALQREDWNGASWPPNVMHVDLWDLVGGMSVEYTPGMYSDPDLAKKLYDAGVRIFKGCGHSLVYHFGSKSTRKVRRNNGKKMFLSKWGYTAGTFNRHILHLGKAYTKLSDTETFSGGAKWINKLKRIKNQF